MGNRTMVVSEGENFSDVAALEDAFKDPEYLTEDPGCLTDAKDRCVVLCKKLGPNVFFIKGGLLIVDESKGILSPEALSVKCLAKIFIVSE